MRSRTRYPSQSFAQRPDAVFAAVMGVVIVLALIARMVGLLPAG